MLTLYVLPGCPFCHKVLAAAEELGITFDLKSIDNPENAAALVAKGGKRQTPFLVDDECKVAMYESDDIIAHLKEKHAHA